MKSQLTSRPMLCIIKQSKIGGIPMKTDFYIEYDGKKVDLQKIMEIAKETWKADGERKMKELKQIELYYKPQESTCYYVFQGASKATEEGFAKVEEGSFLV
jgi:hypothetical protein